MVNRITSSYVVVRSYSEEDPDMSRLKTSGSVPAPKPIGSWLAGAVIGSTIITMATSALLLGAGAAIGDVTLGRRPGS